MKLSNLFYRINAERHQIVLGIDAFFVSFKIILI